MSDLQNLHNKLEAQLREIKQKMKHDSAIDVERFKNVMTFASEVVFGSLVIPDPNQ